jgi:methyltransferase (TIGR00027 family)
MKERQRSRTAEAAAAARARHLLRDDPVVFADPFAIHLTSRPWRIICKNRFLNWIVFRHLLAAMHPVQAQILARSRYAEDQLEKSMLAGMDQYVVVGAGLDSFALRHTDLATTLKIYELDHPASQRSKRDRLAGLGIDLPANLELLPVDFERETVADALARSSYTRDRPAFYSWLGTIHYLTRDAVFRTLTSIASFAAARSEIVFDYRTPSDSVDATDLPVRDALDRFAARRGEPFLTSFDPLTFPREVCDMGFELVENLSGREQQARYFQGRKDGLRPPQDSYFVHFRLLRD